jgi:stage III sporulation protein AB
LADPVVKEANDMLRWFGACVAAAACIALGFGFASAMGQRVRALEQLVRGLTLLQRRIVLLAEPMGEALRVLCDECVVFTDVLDHMDELPALAWDAALRGQRGLTEQDAAIVKRVIAESGMSGRDEQERIFQAGIEQLRAHEFEARAKAQKDTRLAKTLGVLAAVMILMLAL